VQGATHTQKKKTTKKKNKNQKKKKKNGYEHGMASMASTADKKSTVAANGCQNDYKHSQHRYTTYKI
jgi:soluble cytochrome b562